MAFCLAVGGALYAVMKNSAEGSGNKAKKFAKTKSNAPAESLTENSMETIKRFEHPFFYNFKKCKYAVLRLNTNPWFNHAYSLYLFRCGAKNNVILSNYYDAIEVYNNRRKTTAVSGVCFYPELFASEAVANEFNNIFSEDQIFLEATENSVIFGFKYPALNEAERDRQYGLCEKALNFVSKF